MAKFTQTADWILRMLLYKLFYCGVNIQMPCPF